MKCPYCNQEIEDGSGSCPICGRSLNEAPLTAVGESSFQTAEAAAPETAENTALTDARPAGQQTSAEMEKEPKKGKRWVVPAAAAVAVAVVGGGIFALSRRTDPKDAVIDAFKSIIEKGQLSPAEEIFGLKEMQEKLAKGSFTDLTLTLDSSSDESVNQLATGRLDIGVLKDAENKKASVSYGIGYAGMDLANAEIYWDAHQFIAAVPELSSKAFVLNYGEDLESQLANSPYLGQLMEENGINVAGMSNYLEKCLDIATDEEGIFDIKKLWSRYREGSKAIDELKEAMTVEKVEKKDYTIDGKTESCQGYHVTITSDALIQFVDTSREFFLNDETLKEDFITYMELITELQKTMGLDMRSPEELQKEAWEDAEKELDEAIEEMRESLGDITMNVYVRKDGKMAGFDCETTVVKEEEELGISGEMSFGGGYNMTANMKGSLELEDGNGAVTLSFDKTGSYEAGKNWEGSLEGAMELDGDAYRFVYNGACEENAGDYDYTASLELFSNRFSVFEINSKGTVENVVKGESLEIVMDSLQLESAMLSLPGEPLVELSGSYQVGPLTEEITSPKGTEFDLLAATEEEYEAVLTEMTGNVFGLMMKLYQ